MRLIDGDALAWKIKTEKGGTWAMLGLVEAAPTVDAVPVVRCGSCRHWGKGKDGGFGDYLKCALDGAWHKSTFYCKSGEAFKK